MMNEAHFIRLVVLYSLFCGPVAANCPPSVVSSFEELHEYCPDASADNGDYACYKHDRVVCRGSIDHRHTPPSCTHSSIRDCGDDEYYHVCAYGHKNCNHRSDFTFVCWDKQQGHWCQGSIEPDKGAWSHPTCPREAIYDCGELYRYGLNVDRDCSCSGFFGGPVQYECREPNGRIWCSHRTSFFGGHSSSWSSSWTWSALWVWGTSSHHTAENKEYSATRKSVGPWAIGCIAILAVLAVVVGRRKETRRVPQYIQTNEQPHAHESTALLSTSLKL
ncbi:hypothetical protein FisN_32Lu049 [Fistulifera solaris]|uniref:EGF-like domain-containing protein n=1 Tax=Fistulifera solaris TaxID=1519565 RepID=A0A1Z5KPN0_FISSO|nr:hypothetical protein FisN_32Lu049 [Fistulifera solaris]|eukprot:GAX27961.1 hypothetical protein FisN_32Lu049 [Fistulifera solaris]